MHLLTTASLLLVLCVTALLSVNAAPLSWAPLRPPSSSPQPAPRAAMALGLDLPRSRLIMWGGQGPFDDTWAFNLTDYSWTQITPTGGVKPPARFSMNFGTDFVHQRLVIAVGEGNGRVFFNDVWAFDFATDTWSEITPSSGERPATRYGSAGGISAQSNGTLLVSHGFYGLTRYCSSHQYIYELMALSLIQFVIHAVL